MIREGACPHCGHYLNLTGPYVHAVPCQRYNCPSNQRHRLAWGVVIASLITIALMCVAAHYTGVLLEGMWR